MMHIVIKLFNIKDEPNTYYILSTGLEYTTNGGSYAGAENV